VSPFDPAGLEGKLKELNEKAGAPDFWNDQETAQKVLKEKKRIEDKLNEYHSLQDALDDIDVLLELAEEDPEAVAGDLETAYSEYVKNAEDFRIKTLLDGEYDANNAIVSMHGGSGGTDAKDWAEMLYRMYVRWAERKGYKVKVMDYQDDDEGGINSATILVEGENAYGYLKNEKGVHRLVRISPFDSSGRRHTSFASVDVTPELDDDIEVEIDPDDLRIDTFRSSGAGGQHVNKTDSAIRITHIPTNIVVSCQNERSQHQNRDTAMKLLKSKLLELKEKEHKENLKELKGDYSQITWGSQIRSYVFHPYTMVKDHRTGAEVGNVQAVMDGDLDYFINEELKQKDL
jgi:peptide chain release factor 2